MSEIVIAGNTSGSVTIAAPDVAGTTTLTLPASSGNLFVSGQSSTVTSGTAVTASGTSVTFTGIPSWVKRITVMFDGVSTNGSSPVQIQLGDSVGIETTGYISSGAYLAAGSGATTSTNGLLVMGLTGASVITSGSASVTNTSSNAWTSAAVLGRTDAALFSGAGSKTLSATLDRIRITTVNGTDTFDAGSINILYE